MNLIMSLIIVTTLALFLTASIKKNSYIYYSIATVIAIITATYEILRIASGANLGGFILSLEKVSIRGLISIAFFILVMFAGALNPKWKITRKLLGIRAELAIIGSILMLPHGIIYFTRFILLKLPKMFSEGTFSVLYLEYIVVGIIGFIIMIPLFITSIKKIRRRMKAVKWKRLQRWAYAFYFLAYLHIVLILFNDKELDYLRLITYTAIFGSYTVLRLFKYEKMRQAKLLAMN
ncbi:MULTISPECIES: ferric reductase-like transmembrane domain-containing protein [Clostridium]|uniref:Ferric reductase-like transmembrane domain-containing protein n=1 Tax=Clostridium cibarium TaxID=2762247 RepID=A0ABR8PRD7_9CLOT|nr:MULTISPECIES: ferric reductase-like transmembrane domain-containing protein [Clostridium]MBD7910738.1 ferric reductase-like transmembrane domain-containing protein [Clostridium cibarium]